jgi:hypothetical protein
MNEVLTAREIEQRYPNEWVLVLDPAFAPDLEVLSGVVACHSKDRDEVYNKAIELQPKASAFLYTGEFPTDTVLVL